MQQESMFGPGAADVRDSLEQQFVRNNSSLDLGNMSARAGYAIGTGLGGLMGREDPRINEARQVQEAVNEVRQSGVDMSDPVAYYKKMAGIFGAKGLTKQAEQAALKALEYQDKSEERKFKTEDRKAQLEIRSQDLAIKNAQLAKEMAKAKDHPNFATFQALLKDVFAAGKVDSESVARAVITFNKTNGDVNAALEEIKNAPEKAKEVTDRRAPTVEANGKVYVLDAAAAAANPSKTHPTLKDYVEAGGSVDRTPKVTIHNPSQAQESEFAKAMGKQGAERIGKLTEIKALNSDVLAQLNSLEPFVNSMRSGMGAVPLSIVDKFAASFGGGDQLKKSVNDTVMFNKIVRNLVASKVKQLGTNPTDSDRNFVENILPTISDPVEAIKASVAYYKQAAKRAVEAATKEINFIASNRGQVPAGGTEQFTDFNTSAMVPGANTLQGVSDEELMRALKKKQGK